ncbi:Guanylate kinase [Dirofilaria immitis]|nr:Guanylate kinase [Dirofilaria immitis]
MTYAVFECLKDDDVLIDIQWYKRTTEEVVCNEIVKEDPETGVKRRTVITERVITTKTFHIIPIDSDVDHSATTVNETAVSHIDKPKMLSTAELTYRDGKTSITSSEMSCISTTRIIQLTDNPFRCIDYDRVGNLMVITRMRPDSIAKDIRAGDAIVEINGIPVTQIKQLTELKGSITLKIIPTPLHQGPSVYYRAIIDYDGSHDSRVPINFNALNLRKGDVIQAFSKDSNWVQGRKVNDLNQTGLCPVNVLGVGRRTLKAMLLTHLPHHFATAIPYTSRIPKPNELEGREYYFRTKEEMLERIRTGDMIEWGELDEQLYGTSMETVRSCIRSGRVCLLDCEPQALQHLYNAEFMPFVVLIAPPGIDDFRELNKFRPSPYSEEQMMAFIRENKELMESSYARMFNIVLVNKNLNATFKKLIEILDELRDEVQWVPEAWLR